MGLETGTYISDLNASNPVGASDPKSQGDDHLRLIKSTILATFPNITGAVTLTHTQLNDAARKSVTNEFTQTWSTTEAPIRLNASLAYMEFLESDAAADNKVWLAGANGEEFTIWTRDDAQTGGETPLKITRTGTVADAVELNATTVILKEGAVFRILDSGETDYVDVSHNGTDLLNVYTNTDWHRFRSLNSGVLIEDGGALRIYDSTDADYAAFSHDGSNFAVDFVNTNSWDIDGLTGGVKLLDGAWLRIFDSTNSDRVQMSHDGTDVNFDFTNTTDFNINDGVAVKIFDSTTDYLELKHDGTNASIDSNAGSLDLNSLSLITDNDTADEVGFKGAPHNEQNGDYTLVIGDAGKTIYKASGGAGETITIPANASVAFPVGTIIIVANDGGGDLTIAITTDTLEEWNTGTTGSQTLPDNNKAILEKVTSTLWKYSATG